MTNEQAQKKARTRWGKSAAVRNNESFSGPDKRQAASERVAQLKAERDALLKEKTDRLKALDWLTELNEKISATLTEINHELPKTHYHRFDVGRLGGIEGFKFFEVLGSGDTWEEAFAKADGK